MSKRAIDIVDPVGNQTLPDDIIWQILSLLDDYRIIGWQSVSQKWNVYIKQFGVKELVYRPDIYPMKMMKNLRNYSSLKSLCLDTFYLDKSLFWKRGVECFNRLETVAIVENKIRDNDYYLESLKYMTSLISLNLCTCNQNVPSGILSSLINLRNLKIVLSSHRNYGWLSEMTQIETLFLSCHMHSISNDTNLHISLSISNLTQLKKLEIKNVKLDYSNTLRNLKNLNHLSWDLCDLPDNQEHIQVEHISHLIDLESLSFKGSSFKNITLSNIPKMNRLKCITLCNIPSLDEIDIKMKFPLLNHINFRMDYYQFSCNIENLIKFMIGSYRIIEFGFSVYNLPYEYRYISNNYYLLLDYVLKPGQNFVNHCSCCDDGKPGNYLKSSVRRFFYFPMK